MQSKYWQASEVLAGITEQPLTLRGTFPRFMVKADGETTVCKTLKTLQKTLDIIYAGRPRVFVNAGKGITIDFD